MCMENSLPFLSVLPCCLRQLLLEKHQRELSEHKAIGRIQNYLPLFYQAL